MVGEISVRRSRAARSVAIAGVLTLVGVAVVIVLLVLQPDPTARFEAAQFRAARGKGDTDVMQTQARLAVEQRALLGISATQLQAVLGKPTSSYRGSARMVWQVGGRNTSGSPGTKLEVRLDGRMQRVITTRLDSQAG